MQYLPPTYFLMAIMIAKYPVVEFSEVPSPRPISVLEINSQTVQPLPVSLMFQRVAKWAQRQFSDYTGHMVTFCSSISAVFFPQHRIIERRFYTAPEV